MPQLTEKILSDAGGWQAMREARALLEARRVVSASWRPPLLQGVVAEGARQYRCGLRVRGPTDIDNLCACPLSRREGILCAHSLAVGLAVIRGQGELTSSPSLDGPVRRSPSLDSSQEAAPAPGRAGWREAGPEDIVPARLHIVFPPDPARTFRGGRFSLAVEAECRGARTLAGALAPHNRVFAPEDAAVVRAVETLGAGFPAGPLMVDLHAAAALLEALRGHPRITLARKRPLRIPREAVQGALRISSGEEGALHVEVRVPEGSLFQSGERLWILTPEADGLLPLALPPRHRDLLSPGVRFPDPTLFFSDRLPDLADCCRFPEGFRLPEPVSPQVALRLEGALHQIVARCTFRYAGRIKNRTAEAAAFRRLESLGFCSPDASGTQVLQGREPVLAFVARGLPALARDWEVSQAPGLLHALASLDRIQPRVTLQASGTDWFRCEIGAADASGRSVPPEQVRRLLASGRTHGRLASGKTAVFDPAAFEELEILLRDCEPVQDSPGSYRVSARFAAYFAATVEGVPGMVCGEGWRDWRRALDKPVAPVDPGPLRSVLRPYQREGVEWMAHLSDRGCGGILADDMGLGKTVQALGLVAARPGRTLVVCPSALVFNWTREAGRFLPELRVLPIVGPERGARFAELEEADLVITSYALLRRDRERYEGCMFETLILDEAQHIKNPDSQNARAAYGISARRRFALSGTPLENSVHELWSLMQFLMPGYLGTREDFRERYERPILSGSAPETLARLRRRVGPFVKRRLKRDVLAELPPRIDHVAACELTPLQRDAYRALLDEGRRKVDDALRQAGAGPARLAVLTALLRLRQLCCDPRLIGLEAGPADSAKLELCVEILQEAVDGGHRALVFSQFTSMLALLRTALDRAGLAYAYLDGSTRDRQEVVDRFQNDPAIPVFLVSLKAGGTGLNLTAADTVIHYDPWWNPAVEEQAADRAYRIGQERVVTTYRLVARGTVEERILELQERKRSVARGVLDDDPEALGGTSLEELRELLA